MKQHAALFVLFSAALLSPAHALDERYPSYKPYTELSGRVEIAGAPAPRSLMLLWTESFRMLQPDVSLVETEPGRGEVKIRAAMQTLAILVHKDNPLDCLPLSKLRAVYANENPVWGDAGATGEWAARPVERFVREPGSSDNGFFAEKVLGGAALPANAETVTRATRLLRALQSRPGGIGYAPAGYRGENVRPLKISDGGDCAAPSIASVQRAVYPLARLVHLEGPASEAGRAFFDYVLSSEGQHDATIAGFYPLPWIFAVEERTKLGLD
ncbi:ABC-type phosphate transport system periplasmic component-like protein [Parvibaculum lavamentivorans DS-1]|uniref:ABC-type phosphate transport system periplasmic component-like protein n=1 Tax=Parvibaculum lavamentivorans (strain DS-1 / DSM 13023 / NCIMB 13966) TaxID=402881 RepID=A7HP37_PARL1|nr:substrate-binding domain-containing protein [Parvibaculum lavamentivorans]ABS61670.1 ABC-type phosphate transport system periplasmic component-like protein [Parvibaculum lavamentivorans DS-1]